jgi:hypothetical protein
MHIIGAQIFDSHWNCPSRKIILYGQRVEVGREI